MNNHSNIRHKGKLFQYWIALSIAVIAIFSMLAYKTNIYKLTDYTKATFLVLQGNKAYHDGNWGNSNVSYLKASTVSPEYGKLQFNLANTYYQQGRYGEARKIYNKLLTEKNNTLKPAIWNNLGNTWYMDGDIFQSFAAYKKSLLLNDKDAVVRQNFLFLNSKVQQFLTTGGHPTNQSPKGAAGGTQKADPRPDEPVPHKGLDGEQPLGPYKTSDRDMDRLLSMSLKSTRVPSGTLSSGPNKPNPDKDGPDF